MKPEELEQAKAELKQMRHTTQPHGAVVIYPIRAQEWVADHGWLLVDALDEAWSQLDQQSSIADSEE